MSRRLILALLLGAVSLLVASASSYTTARNAAAAKDKPSVTVKVNCLKGESVNDALSKNQTAQNLVVEVSGLCHESVVITRDGVTLRGADPDDDGVEADGNTETTDAAVWVRGAHHITLENLTLTGGFSGLLATDVNLPSMIVTNCRMEGNSNDGVQLQQSLVEATDTAFDSNGSINAEAFGGSRLQCTDCTFSNPQGGLRLNAIAFGGSRLLCTGCTLTGGGVQSDGSLALFNDSSIQHFAPNDASVKVGNAGTVALTRVQVEGPMRFGQNSTGQLLGVTQTAVPGPANTNSADDSAFVRVADASPASGGPPSIPSSVQGFNLRNFSNFSLLQTSHVAGGLSCALGANAFCSTIANVSGTSNCGLCFKP